LQKQTGNDKTYENMIDIVRGKKMKLALSQAYVISSAKEKKDV